MVTLSKPVAVIDTNVIVDLYSWHDFNDHFEHIITYASSDNVPVNDPKSRMRVSRAREALLLAIYLHKTEVTTFSLSESVKLVERVSKLDRKGKPLDPDERIRREAFTKTFLWFVREQLLVGWKDTMHRSESKGSEADRELLAYAKVHSLPLITNEGFTPLGVNKKSPMQKLAKVHGIEIIKAADFYDGEMDVGKEAMTFFRRFRAEAPKYIEAYLGKYPEGERAIRQIFRDLDRYYYLLLSADPNAPEPKPMKLLTYR